jgi:hypothetical protein
LVVSAAVAVAVWVFRVFPVFVDFLGLIDA